jgi:hypothetical protein
VGIIGGGAVTHPHHVLVFVEVGGIEQLTGLEPQYLARRQVMRDVFLFALI